jgi:hypothetical protein
MKDAYNLFDSVDYNIATDRETKHLTTDADSPTKGSFQSGGFSVTWPSSSLMQLLSIGQYCYSLSIWYGETVSMCA